MAVELLGTDMYRDQHRIIAGQLDEIEKELEAVRGRGGRLPDAVGALRRLLVLLEVDVEHHAAEEEHAIYGPLERVAGVTPTLAACYREHGELRLGIERLRADLRRALGGGLADRVLEDCDALIQLVRIHMAREDEILFPAAEQNLDRSVLAAIPEVSEVLRSAGVTPPRPGGMR